jgi:hypothetical protein
VIGAVSAFVLAAAVMVTAGSSPDRWGATPTAEQVAASRTLLETCRAGDLVDEACVARQFTAAVLAQGPAATLAAFDALRVETPGYAAVCHTAGHAAGTAGFVAAGRDLRRALVDLTPACQGAYQHGVIEAWGSAYTGRTAGELRDVFGDVAAICDAAPGGPARELCFDGFGHAAWFATADRNGDIRLADAFSLCTASAAIDGRLGCAGGIVMQVFAPVTAVSERRPVDAITEFCAPVPDNRWGEITIEGEPVVVTARTACALGAVYPFAVAMGTDRSTGDTVMLERFLDRCASLDTLAATDGRLISAACFDGIGFGLFYAARQDMGMAREWCSRLEPRSPFTAPAAQLRERCLTKLDEASTANG